MYEKRYETVLKRVGAKVRSIRIEKGLSMEQLANQADIEYRQIGRVERGEINATIISLLKIAEALEVDISHFFNNTH